ncbi:TMEM165/GDT1 family protein [Stakelama tenebrarum]|uniref:GDT1 family protein n=1 Tax=Stakelama tenebrarum TaxID=2711215 RepID=A0A6G6Y0H9_9SPHN|nr:TMEM165/GDT1 family protein [Sphingosinithalassobacter tenebrarum]QIG78425.1 TMEM165/GDT1 family protein [Sphingosinithalassobacter tenebrarum]
MEALVPAFIAALVMQVGDRATWLTALLADRYGRPVRVALAATLAHAAGNALAAAAGGWIGPMLTPNAKSLFLALSLIFGGAVLLWRVAPPDRLEGWKLGAFLTPLLGIFILALGDPTQSFTLALAARSYPWFAFAGAALGSMTVAFAAAMLGELAWRKLPLRWVRIALGSIGMIGGAILALSAVRLL